MRGGEQLASKGGVMRREGQITMCREVGMRVKVEGEWEGVVVGEETKCERGIKMRQKSKKKKSRHAIQVLSVLAGETAHLPNYQQA